MGLHVEVRDDATACEACGAGRVVTGLPAWSPADVLPVHHDTDLLAETAGMEAELRGLLEPYADKYGIDLTEFWAERARHSSEFAVKATAVVDGLAAMTVKGTHLMPRRSGTKAAKRRRNRKQQPARAKGARP